ncbi:MAG: DUF6174 domain-containing protein [Gemmatimonadales bacterium]
MSGATLVARSPFIRRVARRIAALTLLALAGCDSIAGTQSDHALWNALEIRNYDFVYEVGCFCAFDRPNPARVTVRGGIVVKIAPDSGIFVGKLPPASQYPTIDSLFAILETAEKNSPDGVTVEFDPTYHYPTRISIDLIKNAIDDEVTYTVKSFTPVIGSQQ